MAEQTNLQQVHGAQPWLNSLNPLTLIGVLLAPMAKLKLKPYCIHLGFQAREVLMDLAAETADFGNGAGTFVYQRRTYELCQHPHVSPKQCLKPARIALRSIAVEDKAHGENTQQHTYHLIARDCEVGLDVGILRANEKREH